MPTFSRAPSVQIRKEPGARLAPGPAWWSIGDLNPWPRHCQCRALPAALMPHGIWLNIMWMIFLLLHDGHGIHSCMREHERCQPMQTKNLFDETKWWTWRDSNSLPLRCERSALPGELQARMYEKTDRLQVPTKTNKNDCQSRSRGWCGRRDLNPYSPGTGS